MRTRTEEIVRTKSPPVVSALAQIPEVKGILCFGSYAMGTFDRDSDVDLYVLCHPDIASSPVRLDALQRIDGVQDLQIDHAGFGWDNQWCPRGDRCCILFAINSRYDPATKRTEEAIRNLEIVPDRFHERYSRILETPLTIEGRKEIVNTLEMLLGEIGDLAKG